MTEENRLDPKVMKEKIQRRLGKPIDEIRKIVREEIADWHEDRKVKKKLKKEAEQEVYALKAKRDARIKYGLTKKDIEEPQEENKLGFGSKFNSKSSLKSGVKPLNTGVKSLRGKE